MSSAEPGKELDEIATLIHARIEKLRPKLLDLTRRNPLLSTKFNPRSTSIVRVVDELPDVLAFHLTTGKKMRIAPLPRLDDEPRDEQSVEFLDELAKARRVDETYLEALAKIESNAEGAADLTRAYERDLRDRIRLTRGMAPRQTRSDVSISQHAINHHISPSFELPYPRDEHNDGRHRDDDIQTLYLPDDLERKLNALSTKCKTWSEETGLDVLHAAFSFLEWTEPSSTDHILSPLILLPIVLTKKRTNEGTDFFVEALGEPAETNLVLAEKMRLEFGIDFPKYDGVSLEQYFTDVASISPKATTWKVRRQVVLGVFPSSRIAMYYDLDTSKQSFHKGGVISSLFGGTSGGAMASFADEYEVDQPEIECQVPNLVLDADSSQFSTLVDVASGKSLSVEGPPGTGKSQTIVNAIAGAIASGRKVLFVAEKMAALEVVKSRLEAINLGEFILPLQAGRSTREQVVNSVRQRLEMTSGTAVRDLDAKVEKFRSARTHIAEYLTVLKALFEDTGIHVYEILGKCIATNELLESAPRQLQLAPIDAITSFHRPKIESAVEAATAIEVAWKQATYAQQYWKGTTLINQTALSVREMTRAAEDAHILADGLQRARSELLKFGVDSEFTTSELKDVQQNLLKIKSIPQAIDAAFVSRLTTAADIAATATFLDGAQRCINFHSQLIKRFENPNDKTIPSVLRRISDLCAEVGIQTLNEQDWNAIRDSRRSLLGAIEQMGASVSGFLDAFPPGHAFLVRTLRAAGEVVQSAGRDLLSLRALLPADTLSAIPTRQLIDNGLRLRDERDRLSEVVSVHADIPNEVLRAHVAALKSRGIIQGLTTEFRSAKRTYLTITKRDRFEKGQASEDLRALADWKDSAQRFFEDAQARTFFASLFRGVDTDFDRFDRLLIYYGTIESDFPGPANRQVRELLKSGELDVLSMIPTIPDGPWDGTCGALKELVEEQRSNLAKTNLALKELGFLVEAFRSPLTESVSALDQIADQFEKFIRAKAALDANVTASKLIQERYKGWKTDARLFAGDMQAAAIVIATPYHRSVLCKLLSDGALEQAIGAIAEIVGGHENLHDSLDFLSSKSGIDFHAVLKPMTVADKAKYLRAAASDREGIFAHSGYGTARVGLAMFGVEWIVDVLVQQGCGLANCGALVEATIFRALIIAVDEKYGGTLSKFPGTKLDESRNTLASVDREVIRLSRQLIRNNVINMARPAAGNGVGKKSTWTDMALITNECSKKKRFISVRDLTKRAGNALLEIKPCWMMSPLAVAQYLPKAPDLRFDLCIIDEASQMPPEDAIGALARCGQVMVVGDTNQLPPTTFFQKIIEDEQGDEDESVLEESILEMANGVFRPSRRLRWHYRSQHAGLIQFSNNYIYGNNLVVFPSAAESRVGMGVSLVPVKGCYRGGVNSDECSAMVAAACRFMRSNPDRSLGLVTLNQKQRDLLLEEMEHALSRDSAASNYVTDWQERKDGLESFFIKNLENVQGDERDVIFIGTVYGPERLGAPVMQRFGPINGLAGRRRLNVLFSRAKQQVVTFSSMTAADIRAEEGGNEGALLLKRWLEYSATGVLQAGELTQREADSDFELYVADQIRSIGCIPVPQVGVAGYFIDIGVKHPVWPHGYIFGVECDGATYHSSRSARDRDRLREEVLAGLGWKLHRIWSTDWFNDPNKEVDRLRLVVEERLNFLKEEQARTVADWSVDSGGQLATEESEGGEDDTGDLANVEMQAAEHLDRDRDSPVRFASTDFIEVGDTVRVRFLSGTPSVVEATLSDVRNAPTEHVVHVSAPLGSVLLGAEEGDQISVLAGNFVREAIIEKVTKGKKQPQTNDGSALSTNKSGRLLEDAGTDVAIARRDKTAIRSNTEARAWSVGLNPEKFYENTYLPVLQKMGTEIIDSLGPITFRHLSVIIARAHEFGKTGTQIRKQVWAAVGKRRPVSKSPTGENIFWPDGGQVSLSLSFRGLTVNGEVRGWQDVPYPEKFGLALEIAKFETTNDLAAAMAVRIGFSRLRQVTRDELETLIISALEKFQDERSKE